MSTDGTLPPGCSHEDIERRFGGVEPDTCSHCFETLKGGEAELDLCDPCAAKHFRGLFHSLKKKRKMVEMHGEMLAMDGYDDCIAGICTRYGQEPVIIYDRARVIARLMDDGMTEDEAEEFHEFNQAGAWMGERTPAFIIPNPKRK